MQEVTVVIPNYNGQKYLKNCLNSLQKQTINDFSVIVVDNGSTDDSCSITSNLFPAVQLLKLPENLGFCRAVNEGIKASATPYVILLNNDTQAQPDFVEQLLKAIKCRRKAFSCAAMMLQEQQREQIDSAGDFYNALGWAFARGKGKAAVNYSKSERIFSACGGAAIYRREVLDQIGLFDEAHFAYMEDMDIGYRAKIFGYDNWFIPQARVYHVGSGTSGSRYNQFKIRYSSRNNVYTIYKNMPWVQLLLNLPLLVLGFAIKTVFFAGKGYGREYIAGIKNGFALSRQGKKQGKKVHFQWRNSGNYIRIQGQLWWNIIRRITN